MNIHSFFQTCVLGVALMTTSPAVANPGSKLGSFWKEAGGSVQVNGSTFYRGQQAGYLTPGSLHIRAPQKNSQLAHLRLPSIRAGCSGIDIFGGSFSFISEEELIALMEAIMTNATAFAFELALESLSPAVQEQVSKLRDLLQKVNAMNINSCEAGQLLTSALLPQIDGVSQNICSTVGQYTGRFADFVQSRHRCGTGGQMTATLANAPQEVKDQIPVDINYAWEAIKKNAYFENFGGSESFLAYWAMSMTGTVIVTQGSDDSEPRQYRLIPPTLTDADAIDAILFGGDYPFYRCDETEKCLNPTKSPGSFNNTIPFQKRAYDVVNRVFRAILNDQQLPFQDLAMLSVSTLPVYQTLVTAIAERYSFVDHDLRSIADLVAIDILLVYVEEVSSEMLKGLGAVQVSGDTSRQFEERLTLARQALYDERARVQGRYAEVMAQIEHLMKIRKALAATTLGRISLLGNQ